MNIPAAISFISHALELATYLAPIWHLSVLSSFAFFMHDSDNKTNFDCSWCITVDMAGFSSALPRVSKKCLRRYATVCVRFNFEVHVLRTLTMWKSVNQMMETIYSMPSLQVSYLITPKLHFTSTHFQLPSATTFNFALWYCLNPKFVEQQHGPPY